MIAARTLPTDHPISRLRQSLAHFSASHRKGPASVPTGPNACPTPSGEGTNRQAVTPRPNGAGTHSFAAAGGADATHVWIRGGIERSHPFGGAGTHPFQRARASRALAEGDMRSDSPRKQKLTHVPGGLDL